MVDSGVGDIDRQLARVVLKRDEGRVITDKVIY
jgi:hypothetical protein